jgi:hypothetical protein
LLRLALHFHTTHIITTQIQAVWRFLEKLKIELAYDPAIPLLDIYPKVYRQGTGYNRDTCTLMSITALFTTAKRWNQLKSPTTDGWIKNVW